MDKAVKYKIVAWLVAIFLLVLMPQGVNKPSQVQTIAIVSGLGIDKTDNQLEVSAQIIIPQASGSYAQKNLVASANGKTLTEAITNIELKVGQELGLAHCYIIILGDEILNEDITIILDYLMRSNIMGNNSALLHTTGKAKELLEVSSQLSEADINNLQNIAKYNQQHYNSSNTNLIELFNDYLSPCPYSLMGSVNTDQTENNQQNSSNDKSSSKGTSNTSNSSSTQNSGSSNVLKNDGSAIVIKKGKKLTTLTKDQLIKFNWLDPKTTTGYLTLENWTDENLKNVTIVLEITSRFLSFNPRIVNNHPILETNLNIEAKIECIENTNGTIDTSHKNYFTNSFTDGIKNKIKQEIEEALQISKDQNFDIMHIYNIFNASNHKAWKKYLSSLNNSEEYIQDVEIITNIKIANKE